MSRLTVVCTLALCCMASGMPAFADAFSQTNLVSDIAGQAANTDPNLKDPWGIAFSPTSPLWVSDRGTGVSTLYNGQGVASALIVTVPPGTAAAGPTGQVFAGGTSFRLNSAPVSFIFDTLGGTIAAWNGSAGTTAVTMASTPGANYTGLALANNTLYAANFKMGGNIDVFDSSFAPTTLAGKFVDPNLPAGYAAFNVQALNGSLYVEYAKVTPGVPVALPGGGGYVDQFDVNGTFVKRVVSNGQLNGPWGIAAVPSTGFGTFAAGDLLIGNFDGGQINAYDANGNFIQTLTDSKGNALANAGLWALAFDPGAPGANDPGALYFTAGPNQGNDGLLGKIDATPEPATWGVMAAGLMALAAMRRVRKNV